jgi:DNA-binding response OmpR family regulator
LTLVRNGRQEASAKGGALSREPLPLRIGDIEFDRQRGLIRRAGRTLRLSPTEFRLFALLISNPGKAFSREDLIRRVWPATSVDTRTVDVTIGRLRKAVTWGWHLDPISSVYRRGYKFDEGFARQCSDWAVLGKRKLRLGARPAMPPARSPGGQAQPALRCRRRSG